MGQEDEVDDPRPHLPSAPDLIAEERRSAGGKWKKRVFARLIWQGLDPYDAFLKADYPVIGVNHSGGTGGGWTQAMARRRAAEMAQEPWCREWAVGWSIDPKEQVKSAVPEAIALLVDGLDDRTSEGRISGLAVRCAENLLDRGGIVRSQTIEHEGADGSGITKDAKELVRLIRARLEELDKPVAHHPALDGVVIEMKKADGG